jgi:hypothetical protein
VDADIYTETNSNNGNGDDQKKKESITPKGLRFTIILNRNNKGGYMIKERLDEENSSLLMLWKNFAA